MTGREDVKEGMWLTGWTDIIGVDKGYLQKRLKLTVGRF